MVRSNVPVSFSFTRGNLTYCFDDMNSHLFPFRPKGTTIPGQRYTCHTKTRDAITRPAQGADGEIVRHVYLDEAGIAGEDFTVVAGFMLHVDNQYKDFVNCLDSMARELFGNDLSRNFAFHAKELVNGGKFFPREKWSREKTLEILDRLADLPRSFNSPVIYAAVSKEEISYEKYGDDAARLRHIVAFQLALKEAEIALEKNYPGECAFLIVEDNTQHRRHLRHMFDFLYNKYFQYDIKNMGIEPPFNSIVETPLFQPKNGTSPMQVADVCAYLIRKRLEGDLRTHHISERLTPQLLSGWRTKFMNWGNDDEGDWVVEI